MKQLPTQDDAKIIFPFTADFPSCHQIVSLFSFACTQPFVLFTDSGIVDSNEPSEERTSHFHRKKSKQSLEAVAPTLSTWPIVSHEESGDITKNTNQYLVSSAGNAILYLCFANIIIKPLLIFYLLMLCLAS